MGGLHKVTRTVILFLIVGALGTATAADYCSLIVRVLSPDGQRVEALVSVEENGGRTIERDPSLGDVRFCDLGIAPVTVKVGADGTCNQVVVRDVPLRWQEQYLLRVTYDPEPCLGDLPHPPVPVCRVLFRITGINDNWLDKASIRFLQPQLAPRMADSAGRALLILKSGDRTEATVSSSGYVPKTLELSCSPSEPIHETLIKLEKSPDP